MGLVRLLHGRGLGPPGPLPHGSHSEPRVIRNEGPPEERQRDSGSVPQGVRIQDAQQRGEVKDLQKHGRCCSQRAYPDFGRRRVCCHACPGCPKNQGAHPNDAAHDNVPPCMQQASIEHIAQMTSDPVQPALQDAPQLTLPARARALYGQELPAHFGPRFTATQQGQCPASARRQQGSGSVEPDHSRSGRS